MSKIFIRIKITKQQTIDGPMGRSNNIDKNIPKIVAIVVKIILEIINFFKFLKINREIKVGIKIYPNVSKTPRDFILTEIIIPKIK